MIRTARRISALEGVGRCLTLAAMFAILVPALLALDPPGAAADTRITPIGLPIRDFPPAGTGCTPPTVDGDLTDLEVFATCLTPADGCGFVVADNEKDICAPSSFIPCNVPEACPSGGTSVYFANGADLIEAVFAYDRASDTFYFGARVVSGHAIGDADGGGTAVDDCGAPGNIIDQAGIGLSEPYNAFIDINCDDKPEFNIEVSGNTLKLNGVAVPGTDGGFATSGSNLELFIEGLGLPHVVRFFAQGGFSFDGLEEDKTDVVECPEPNPNVDVLCSGPTSICAGSAADYTVTVTNTGEAPLANVSATATIPAGLNFDQILSSDNFDNCSELGGVITCTESSLPVGGVRTLSFRVVAKADCFGDVAIASHAEGTFSQPGCVEEVAVADDSNCPVLCIGIPGVDIEVTGPEKVCEGAAYTVNGTVTNTSITKTESIRVTGPNGFDQTFDAVGPGEVREFSQDFTAPSPCEPILHSYTAFTENSCGSDEDTDEISIDCNNNPHLTIEVSGPAKVCEGAEYTVNGTVCNTSIVKTIDITVTGPLGFEQTFLAVPAGECRDFSQDLLAPSPCGEPSFRHTYFASTSNSCGTDNQSDFVDIECNNFPHVDVEVSGPAKVCEGRPYTVEGTVTNTSTAKTIDITVTGPNDFQVTFPGVPAGESRDFDQDFTAPTPCAPISHSYTATTSNDCGSDDDTDQVDIDCNNNPHLTIDVTGPAKVCEGAPYTVNGTVCNTSIDKIITIFVSGPSGFQATFFDVPAGECRDFSQDLTAPSPCGAPSFRHTYFASTENACDEDTQSDFVDIDCNNVPRVDVDAFGPAKVCEGAEYRVNGTVTNTSIDKVIDITVNGPEGFQQVFDDVAAGDSRDFFQDFIAPSPCTGIGALSGADIVHSYTASTSNDCGSDDDTDVVGIDCNNFPHVDIQVSGPAKVCEGRLYTVDGTVTNTSIDKFIDITVDGPNGFQRVFDDVPPGVPQQFSQDFTAPSPCAPISHSYTATTRNDCGSDDDTDRVDIDCNNNPRVDIEARGPEKVCEGAPYTVEGSVCNTSTDKIVDITVTGPNGFQQTFDDVPAGECRDFSQDLTAPSPCGGDIELTYTATTENSCGDADDVDLVNIACNNGPNPAIDVVAEPGKVCPGEEIEVTATATNNSTEPSHIRIKKGGVVVQDCGVLAPGGTCEYSETVSVAECPTPLAGNGSIFEFCFTAVGSVPTCPDRETDPDCAQVVCNTPDVDIEKDTDVTSTEVGSLYEVTLTITNTGSSTLDPVIVCDQLPAEAGFDTGQTIGGTCGATLDTFAGNEVCFTSFALDPGQSCTIIYDVLCGQAGDQTDVTTVTAYCDGTFPDNPVTDTDEATVSCAQSCCWMTSGGFLNACSRSGHKDDNFGGNVGPPPHGSWQHVQRIDNQITFNFHSHDANVLACFDTGDPDPCHPAGEADSIVFGGTGEYSLGNGPRDHDAWWFAVVADNGEPGRRGDENGGCGYPDYYAIYVFDDAAMTDLAFSATGVLDCTDEGGNLDGGNLQVRDCRNAALDADFMGAVRQYWLEYEAIREGGDGDGGSALTGIGSESSADLYKPIPNPFTGTTRMAYAVTGAAAERVEISIYNTSGQRVRTLLNGTRSPGRHEAVWDGRDEKGSAVPAGVYFYRAVIGNRSIVSRVTFLR